MLVKLIFTILLVYSIIGCKQRNESMFSETEKLAIRSQIEKDLAAGIEATRIKDIDAYMERLPNDLRIYDERGEIVSRDKQRSYVLRDWSIIDTTLAITMDIDSIQYISKDSIYVYTSQFWERMMFQRDGVTLDTVVTTQKHKETWKKNPKGWYGYTIVELGGKIYINGELYKE